MAGLLGVSSAAAGDYEVGQVWKYQTRPNEDTSQLSIIRIDQTKSGKIYSIRIDGVRINNPYSDDGLQTVLPHAPVDRNTLDNSVTELVGALSTEPSDFADGYEIWKESFETGDAGVFDIPVTQIIEFVEDAVNREYVQRL